MFKKLTFSLVLSLNLSSCGPQNRETNNPVPPDQAAYELSVKKHAFEDMAEEQKQEFIYRFIEESRKKGYEVEINEHKKIVSVKKIEN